MGPQTQNQMSIRVQRLDPASRQASQLVGKLDAYLLDLYPVESNHLDSIDELSKAHVHFLGAFENGQPAGCGAIKLLEDYAEIKRIYVVPTHRGKGVARRILLELESIAYDAAIRRLLLETGVRQPEALLLFEKHGYCRTERYGDYPDDPLSVFMEKTLP